MSLKMNLISLKDIVIKILLIISFPCLTMVFSRVSNKNVLIISLLLSAIIGLILVHYFYDKILKKFNYKLFVASLIICDVILGIYYNFHFQEYISSTFYLISTNKFILVTLFAFPALTFIIYYLIDNLNKPIIHFFRGLDRFDKKFLVGFSIVFLLLAIFIYGKTTAFYYGNNIQYDIIYTTDSSDIYRNETFLNVNSPYNEPSKQPLFGVFALPFGFLALVLSKVLFFIPNSYIVCLSTVQFCLFLITILMITRLLKLNTTDKRNFCLIFISLFSTIVFAFTLEQYIISLFYLILLLYAYYYHKNDVNYTYVSGVGTLTTTGVLLPFISKNKNFKSLVLNIFKCIILFVGIIVLFGQLSSITTFFENMFNNLDGFAGGDISFIDRIKQYLNFVKGIFIPVSSTVVSADESNFWYPQYLLSPVYNFSKFGIAILCICLLSFILNRKNKIAQVSAFWVLYSIIILCFIGFGTQENGLILYSLYFSWAFMILCYLLFIKIIKKSLLRNVLTIIICACLLFLNIPAFNEIINFGIMFYPN